MKKYITPDEWCIIEEGFHPEDNEITESLMSLGNGRMGQRGNFEETYTGKSLLGNYVAGVYFPIKPGWVGGKTAIPIILPKSSTPVTGSGSTWKSKAKSWI